MLLTELNIHDSAGEECLQSYWQAGLEYILADNPEDAQGAFLMPFLEGVYPEEFLQHSLSEYLIISANDQEKQGELDNADKILSLATDIFPSDVNILLRRTKFSLLSGNFDPELLAETLRILDETEPEEIEQALMAATITQFLRSCNPKTLATLPPTLFSNLLTLFLSKSIDQDAAITTLHHEALIIGGQQKLKLLELNILETCLNFCSANSRFSILSETALIAAHTGKHERAIQLAELCCADSKSRSKEHQVVANYTLLFSLMEAGKWQLIPAVMQEGLGHIMALNDQDCTMEMSGTVASTYFYSYLTDQPEMLQKIRSNLGKIYGPIVKAHADQFLRQDNQQVAHHHAQKVLRIGYICSTFSKHSVGWLSRWLFGHHDRQNFQIFIYNVAQSEHDEFHQKYFKANANASYYFNHNAMEIAKQIEEDEIDILVDLDSLTSVVTYGVMCCKPAPIQITWLGWENSGCPEVDYFMADPYVLPSNAEEYYATKIWRLPQTYIAVDGFEVGTPNKRRADYNIPADAIVYLCTQKSYKHHPDILQLQMQIIREVPNSYLLIKVTGSLDATMDVYQEVADRVGISIERLRFLDMQPDEYTHRANLNLADIVLDTFPYNGATTTLETIWAGVPIVTKVGQSFMARNSYAFLTNAGIAEGIAYSDQEYVDWGIKLGQDLELRQQVSGKMLQSRKTSPLWDGERFTQDMENAYKQMWDIHQQHLLVTHHTPPIAIAPPIKLHIGGQTTHPEWKIFDALDRPEVDFLGNANDLSQFPDNTIATIYASHVLEHFYYLLDNELLQTLQEWHRVLQPGGALMVSVPNLQAICALYIQPEMPVESRHLLMRMIFGGQIDRYDVHRVGFDRDTLSMYLQAAGFRDCEVKEEFGIFQDTSSLCFSGVPISLNMIARK